MTQVDAIYQHGVFRPLHQVGLSENQRVRLSVQPVGEEDARAWFVAVRERRRHIAAGRGVFPDSAPDIAEDRRR